jgi:hypothetical protein
MTVTIEVFDARPSQETIPRGAVALVECGKSSCCKLWPKIADHPSICFASVFKTRMM